MLQDIEQLVCFCRTPTVPGVWSYKYQWEEIAHIVTRLSPKPEHAAFIERKDPLLGYLRDWTEDDLRELGLPSNTLDAEKQSGTSSPKAKKSQNNATEKGENLVQSINRRFGGSNR